jgi:hypothetical protein
MDFLLVDGDMAVFMPSFGAAVVMVRPGKISGQGPSNFAHKKWCIEGDEQSVTVPGCAYLTPSHPIPGVGTLAIQQLAQDQKATKTTSGGAKVLLVGKNFTAKFSVQSPAQQPTASGALVPDATPEYTGMGRFMTTNTRLRAS